MDLQVIVKESDVKYLRELIDKNAPVGYKSITDKEAEDLISENGNPNLAYGAYMVRLEFFLDFSNFQSFFVNWKKWMRRAICYRLVQVSYF